MCSPGSSMADIKIRHNGTELSFFLTVANDGRSFVIEFKEGKQLEVLVEGKAAVELVCPSVEGTVIWCQLQDGSEQFYDTKSGQLLTEEERKARNPHFYT